MPTDPRADLPSVTAVLAALDDPEVNHDVLVALVSEALDGLRATLGGEDPPDGARAAGAFDLLDDTVAMVRHAITTLLAPPGPVINATGVVLHTGLGRAPLSPAAREALAAAAGANAVEVDHHGHRGHRDADLARLVRVLTGASDATFANNGAGALLLALRAVAPGGRVAVSRGELVEIGGSFRLPDIVATAGVELVEIGTTNRTHLHDVAGALDEGVDAVLVVHRSNFRVEGFVARPNLATVARACHDHDAALVHDVGSGLLTASDLAPDEPDVATSLAAGADLVTGSGDKLLGGPQAGLVVGRGDLVERARRDPMARALRLDKLRVAALRATLQDHCRPGTANPTQDILATPTSALAERAERLARHLRDRADVDVAVTTTTGMVGGGSVPGRGLESIALSLPEGWAAPLRAGTPPVMARVADGRCLVDLRTVTPDDDEVLAQALVAVATGADRPAHDDTTPAPQRADPTTGRAPT